MKIFNRGSKLNFVDDNNVLVGWDDQSSCCERYGYIVSRELPDSIEADSDESDLDGFQFDPAWFRELDIYTEDGGAVAFRLTRADEERFLTLFNSHNGYYSHGFSVHVKGEEIRSGSL